MSILKTTAKTIYSRGDIEVLLDLKDLIVPEVPYLILRSKNPIESAQLIGDGLYLFTNFDKEEIKDYNKLLQGQWTHISLECAQRIYSTLSYNKLAQQYFLDGVTISNDKTRKLIAYYNYIRLSTPKISKEIALEFAKILKLEVDKKRTPNIELLPKVGSIIL